MTVGRPTVSVVIATYNRAHLIARAIGSVLDQTYTDFEVIVVDDASTDDTEQVVKEFRDSRVLYARHHENKGGGSARNTGIGLAQGEYVAFLDSDDEWLPNKLRHQVEVLGAMDDSVGLLYSGFVRVYPDGHVREAREPTEGSCVGIPSRWLVKSAALDAVGGFDESMPALQDTEISLRLRNECRLAYDPTIVTRYYVSKDSVCRNAGNILLAAGRLIEERGREITRDELAFLHFLHGKACMMVGEVAEAKASMLQAVLLRPFRLRQFAALLAALLGRRTYLWLRRGKIAVIPRRPW